MKKIYMVVEAQSYDTGDTQTIVTSSHSKELCDHLAKRFEEVKERIPFKEDAKYYVVSAPFMETFEDMDEVRLDYEGE